MSRLLVLAADNTQWHWLEQLFPPEILSQDPLGGFEAVLVLNDHSPKVVRLLGEAMALRSRSPEAPVLVVTPIPAEAIGLTAIVQALGCAGPACALPDSQLAAALTVEQLPVRTHLGADAINFEYSV